MPSLQHGPFRFAVHAPQIHFVEIDHVELARLFHEEGVEVGAIPVRVGNAIMRRRSDQKLTLARSVVREFPPRFVMIKREAALQPAGDLRMALLPGAPLGEGAHGRQIVAVAQFFEDEVGQRRGRFSDGEARMFSLFQEHDRAALPPRNHGGERPSKPGANHRNVERALHRESKAGTEEWRKRRWEDGDLEPQIKADQRR